MPEYPSVTMYVERLRQMAGGHMLEGVRIVSPFLLRTVDPGPAELAGRKLVGVRRLGKRVVLELEGELFAVIHLMIAGRLRWKPKGHKVPGRVGLAAFDFDHATVMFTEASKKRRASLHLERGLAAALAHDPGGLELMDAEPPTTFAAFSSAITARNHTLKRALTDPRILSGIGNAWSDEILHAARLSPIRWTSRLTDEELKRLFEATKTCLQTWTSRFRERLGDGFPDKVTAFEPEMAVHGRYRQPCPVCGSPVQRIRYADNETNYCPPCQTDGKLLADRSLSRLLKGDWPKTLAQLEELKAAKELPPSET